MCRRPFLLVLMLAALLFAAIPAGAQTDQRCFPETGQCIAGRIREFWEQNGGLTVFGFPTTDQHEEQVEGEPFQVQWFERNRLELHPENQRPYDVLLGRLGVDRLVQQGRDWFTFPKGSAHPGCRFFAATGHELCAAFLDYFSKHGLEFDGRRGTSEAESLALFGLPISEEVMETNASGDTVLTQWFERARFEAHPENGPPYDVLLGLLGNEIRANTRPPTPPDPCADVPEPVSARVRPNKCVKQGEPLSIDIFGFQPNERVGFWVTAPNGTIVGTRGTYDIGPTGSVENIPLPTSKLDPGLYSIVFEGVSSKHQAIVYVKVLSEAPPPQPTAPPAPGSVPAANAPCNQNAPAPAEGAQAWMTVPSPGRRSNETLCVRLIVGGKIVSGAAASGVAHYKTTDTALGPATTGADGVAAITFNTGGATSGYTVKVDVTVMAGDQTYMAQTSFTPNY